MRGRRSLASFLILLLIAAIVQPVAPAVAGGVPAVWVWTEDAATNVFHDSRPSASAGGGLRLDTARNEYEAGQIVLRRDGAFTVNQVTFTDLVSGTNRIGAANLEYKFVENTFLDANSRLNNTDPREVVYPVTRKAPGMFPDGLSNKRSWQVPARTTQSVWTRVFVPAATPGGLYRGSATVVTSAGEQTVPIEVDVRPVTIPDAADGGFTNTMWSIMFGELDTGTLPQEPIEQYYGHKRYSAGWWALMDNLAKERKAHRTNNLSVPMMRVLVDGNTRFNHTTGRYEFGWQRFDEVVQFFLDRGSVKRIEAFLWSGNYFGQAMEIIHPDTNRPAWVNWDSTEGKRWHDQYIRALKEHLEAKGWADRFWMHIGDEPIGDAAEAAWLRLADRIRAVWPGVKIGDAAFHEPSGSRLATRADIMIPNLQNYSNSPAVYDAERAKGKELWFYTCNIPTKNYLNRFIDQPQWAMRQVMWMASSRGMSGYLHWAMDKWMYRLNHDGGDNDYQREKGDGYIVLPDKEFNTIRSTVRYEAQRDGIEDWEVLNQLKQTEPALAREIAAGLVPNGHVYTPDTDHMIRVRRLMLDLAAGRTTPDLARAAIATASSGTAANAIDENLSTVWQPTGGSGWLQLDLGRQAHLDALRFRWSGNPPAGLVVKQSADGVRWTQVKSASTLTVLNSKARYLRIETGGALAAVEAVGTALTQPNLALGRTYSWSENPAGDITDTGIEATDGFYGDAWDDGRTTGFKYGPGEKREVAWRMDLGSVQRLSRVRVKAYEEYPAYRPDEVRVLTSVDGNRFISRAVQRAPRGTAGIWYDLEFGAAPVRYVKVALTKTGSADADKLVLDDIEVYAAPAGTPSDLAWGRSYTLNAQPHGAHPDDGYQSTDGEAAGKYEDGLGYGFQLGAGERKTVDVGVDLGGTRSISQVQVAAYDDGEHDYAPSLVQAVVAGAVVAESAIPMSGWYRLAFPAVSSDRVTVRVAKSHGNMAGWLFVDEIRVLGTARAIPVASYQVPTPAAGYGDAGSESADGILGAHYSDHLSYGYEVPSGLRTVELQLDLGASEAVNWVRLREYYDGEHAYAPDQVVVSTSSDRVTWTERSRTDTARAHWFDLTFDPVQARYIRLQVTKAYGHFADYLFLDEVVVHRE